jgi:hypothetical protein
MLGLSPLLIIPMMMKTRIYSFGSLSTTAVAAQKKRRTPHGVLEKHLKEKDQRRNNYNLLKVQKAV